MAIGVFSIDRWGRALAMTGGAVWLALSVSPWLRSGTMGAIDRLLLLAILVLSPLLLRLAAVEEASGPLLLVRGLAFLLHPAAAGCAVWSLAAPFGPAAGRWAAPWLLWGGLAALFGALRLGRRRTLRLDELCIEAGLLYLPVGGAWLLLARRGAEPMGFVEPIVSLTAVHFHYAGFAALILTGLAGRRLLARDGRPAAIFRPLAVGVIAGPLLVAQGIAFSPLLEIVAVVLFASSHLALALLVLMTLAPRVAPLPARILLALSALSLALAMLSTYVYGVGEYLRETFITVPGMLHAHGWINGIGFALCGAIGWSWCEEPSCGSPS